MAASACNEINMNMVEKDNIIFRSYNLSSWKGMCRYFSGDSDCIPNMDLVKYSSNIDELEIKVAGELGWLQDLDEFTIISGDTMTSWDDAKEMLQICEINKYQNSECDNINLDKYLVFADQVSGTWHDKTATSKCTEIGYLIGIKCQNSTDNKQCEPVECPDLLSNTDVSYLAANEFCRELGCGKTARDVVKCDLLKEQGTYHVRESWNDSYGLVKMENKCKNEYPDERVLDFSNYDTDSYNFTFDNAGIGENFGDEDLCIVSTSVDLAKGTTDEQRCQMIGAQMGVFTKVTLTNSVVCGVNDDEGDKCATVTFRLPNFMSNEDIAIYGKFIPNPSNLESEDDFGVKLCAKLNCKATRTGDDVTCAPCDCNSQGTCDLGICQCTGGWSGDNCEINDALCQTVDCNNQGTCGAEGICNCNEGWFGDNCETEYESCVNVDCNNQGTCGAEGICNCNEGWFGDNCQTQDESCANVDCNSQGTCAEGICNCDDEWFGDNCDTQDESCVNVDCNSQGTCALGICNCNDGWSGDNCESASQAVIQFGMALLAIATLF